MPLVAFLPNNTLAQGDFRLFLFFYFLLPLMGPSSPKAGELVLHLWLAIGGEEGKRKEKEKGKEKRKGKKERKTNN